MSKTYVGYRLMEIGLDGEPVSSRCVVHVVLGKRKRLLNPRLDIRNHSPTGFEWGYGGSGPAQLALALVADCCGRKMAVPAIYQRVKRLVAGMPHEGWSLTEEELSGVIAQAVREAQS